MIEVQMTQDHDVDAVVRHPAFLERVEQDVPRLHDAVACLEFRLEKGADTRLEQYALAVKIIDEHRAAGELDAVALVGRDPLRPHRARRVAEHRTAVEPLAIPLY